MTEKKAIYSLGNAPEWLRVAENWGNQLGWKPFYWITVAKNHDAVGAAYPDVHRHDFVDLNRCIPAEAYQDRMWRGLGADVLAEFAEVEQTAIEMMDRMDLGGTFTHGERQRAYLWHLAYWLTIVDDERPEIVVFNAPPHSPGEYVLHEVARRRGVGVRVYLPTQLCSLHMVAEGYDAIPTDLVDAYNLRLDDNDLSVSRDMKDALDEIRSPSGSVPWYVIEARAREERRARQRERIEKSLARGELRNVALSLDPEEQVGILKRRRPVPPPEKDREKIRRVYKRPGQPLDAPVLNREEYRTYLRWAYVEKTKLRQTYESLVGDPDLGRPYVFLALHYQPERTTCPDGGRFNNQFLAASLLANALPEGWHLYVKEHPSQFTYHNNGEQSRRPEFYRDLRALPNTELVPLDMPSSELVLGARAVATVTGFVGWEALLNEIPTIVFGAAWYRLCGGVYNVAKLSDAADALDRIASGERHTLDEVVAFAGALQDVGTVCYSNTSLAPAVEIDSDQLVAALTGAMLRFEGRDGASVSPSNDGALTTVHHQ